ncbi:MAG: HAD-IA family hydrolase [bacterium]
MKQRVKSPQYHAQAMSRRFGSAPKCLIFDLDGTLVDSFADIATALNLTRARFGLPAVSQAEVTRHVGSGSAYLVNALVPVTDFPGAGGGGAEAYRFYLARYREHALEQSRLYAGVDAVLHQYAERSLAVVTNKPEALAEHVLKGLGIRAPFQMVVGGDSLECKKPDPLPILHVLGAVSVQPESAVMIGDGLHDIEAGRAAGLRTVGVSTGVASRMELEGAGADHVLDSLEQLPGLIP